MKISQTLRNAALKTTQEDNGVLSELNAVPSRLLWESWLFWWPEIANPKQRRARVNDSRPELLVSWECKQCQLDCGWPSALDTCPGSSLLLMPHEDLELPFLAPCVWQKETARPFAWKSPWSQFVDWAFPWVGLFSVQSRSLTQAYSSGVYFTLLCLTTFCVTLCTSHSRLWEEEIRSKDRRLILGSALLLLCGCT